MLVFCCESFGVKSVSVNGALSREIERFALLCVRRGSNGTCDLCTASCVFCD